MAGVWEFWGVCWKGTSKVIYKFDATWQENAWGRRRKRSKRKHTKCSKCTKQQLFKTTISLPLQSRLSMEFFLFQEDFLQNIPLLICQVCCQLFVRQGRLTSEFGSDGTGLLITILIWGRWEGTRRGRTSRWFSPWWSGCSCSCCHRCYCRCSHGSTDSWCWTDRRRSTWRRNRIRLERGHDTRSSLSDFFFKFCNIEERGGRSSNSKSTTCQSFSHFWCSSKAWRTCRVARWRNRQRCISREQGGRMSRVTSQSRCWRRWRGYWRWWSSFLILVYDLSSCFSVWMKKRIEGYAIDKKEREWKRNTGHFVSNGR